jgi:hypothetical protein
MKHLVAPTSIIIVLWQQIQLQVAKAVLPPQNPPWPPTYVMKESLITMQCNSSGWSSPSRGAQFGIVSYDWSNAKAQWAVAKPMNCEEALLEQAVLTKQAGAKHVFVYRNIVKALPWFKSVREKLDDSRYEGFFLKFDAKRVHHYHVPPCAAENNSHCSILYHDQEQTPQVPTRENPHPDSGTCSGYCDCGKHHPCGEYLFDHRNGTMLRDFLVHEIVLPALADGVVDGLFLDDYWCSNLICQETANYASGCPCTDPAQGPTEVESHAAYDMGLTDVDIRDITVEWSTTMTVVQQSLLRHGAYTWSLFPGQENANASPILLTPDSCLELLRTACHENSPWQRVPLLFGFSVVSSNNGTVLRLSQLDQDLAFFLLARGPYAYAGWGVWGMTWPFQAEPGHGAIPPLPHGVPLPTELVLLDYGEPKIGCYEGEAGVFYREWTRASIVLDCNSFQPRTKVEETNDMAIPT